MHVRFTGTGRAQLLAALSFVRNENPAAAKVLLRRFTRRLRNLRRFPYSGKRLPNLRRGAYRELVIHPYRVFYRVQRPTIWVVAVWHSAQEPRRQ
ncbi:MAG: type II toxin-antitoxin system RelE/ParE family toxin [Acidobacteria bacterium]|jgi:toxin ParE1/3/4|nr:type II toxin-antitoxin system RelE/ParE family toxin [Acidobacteriota bacterium]